MTQFIRPGQIPAHCPHCDVDFAVPKSMGGGHANCPHCRRVVAVGGGTDILFWFLMGMGALFVLGLAGLLFTVGSLWGGLLTLLIGGGVLLSIFLAS